MDITEKMKMCFNDELMENTILTENEKKVLASLMYSYQICKEAKDNIIIRSMDALRKDIQISTNALYDAIRSLESLYHMIERTAGESRGKEKSSIASKFKLNFEAIFNPPKEHLRFDFSKYMKSSETPINTIDIDTDIVTDTDIDTSIDKDKEINIGIDTNIDKGVEINKEVGNISGKEVVFENEVNNVEINYDIYKDRNTWNKSLPIEMSLSDYEKERLIFELYQLHDITSIERKIDEIELKLRKGKNEIYKEKTRYILNMKSKELGFKFTTIL